MRHRQGKMLKMLLVLLVMAGVATLPAQGWAQPSADICAQVDEAVSTGVFNQILELDADNDGFTNFWECMGISKTDPHTNVTGAGLLAGLEWPGYLDTLSDPAVRLDPNQVNVLFIIKPLSTGSELPDNQTLLKHLSRPKAENGLGIVPLFITSAEVPVGTCPDCPDDLIQDRALTQQGQITLLPTGVGFESYLAKAVRITESDDISDIFLWGKCKQGTPSYLDKCTIYTHALRLGLADKCDNYPSCELKYSDGSFTVNPPYDLTNPVFVQMCEETSSKIAAHEGGHTLALSLNCDRKTGICHNKGSGEVMEAFAIFKRGKWTIGTSFGTSNVDGFQTHD